MKMLLVLLVILVGVGAFVAHSPQPTSKTPAETRAHWRAILHWSDDCESSWLNNPPLVKSQTGLDINQLNNDEFVVLVTCDVAAYQKNVAVYYYNQSQKVIKPQQFLTMDENAHHHLIK